MTGRPLKVRVAIGCGAFLLVALIGLAYRLYRSGQILVRTDPVQRVDLIEARVTASGEVRAKEFIDIQSELAGVIESIAVKEGDAVKQGAVLLRIDPVQSASEMEATEALKLAARAEAKGQAAQIQAAEATLRERKANLLAATAERDQAARTLEIATDSYGRQTKLNAEGMVSEEILQATEGKLLSAKSSLASMEARKASAEARVKLAEVALLQARSSHEAAANRVDQAEANLRRASDLLDKTVITSPIDGIVTYLGVDAGERAVPGIMSNPQATLLTVADLSHIQVELRVDETDILAIHKGDPAEVTVDALPETGIHGTVTEIGASPLPTLNQQGDAAKDFKVVVTLEKPPATLRPGLSASAEIVTAHKKDVLTVPYQSIVLREALFDDAGRYAGPAKDGETDRAHRREQKGVFLVDGSRARFRPVTTGIAGEMEVEVTSGVKQGEEVVSGSFRTLRKLQDGDRIRVDAEAAMREARRKD